MAGVSNPKIKRAIPIVILIALLALSPTKAQSQDGRPIADAGSSRYAATDPVQLDGTGSYDPDESGVILYSWQQISGPMIIISDANTSTPNISGFIQTEVIQECEFELVVSDGELTSLPDTVKVIIVPDFGENILELENDSFDPNKPTIIYFGGGDCTFGEVQYSDCPLTEPGWLEKANIMYVPKGYGPDPGGGTLKYYQCGDMIIVYLSEVAPNYKQSIQTSGWSTGGQPAIDAGRYLNLTYKDRRYAINRVTFFDATPFCRNYSESIAAYLDSSVDGEQCWVDNYVSTPGYGQYSYFYNNILNIWFDTATNNSYGQMARHRHAQEWYNNSITKDNMKDFNSGVVAGAYWSVIGPGKNLQLASTPDTQTYKFQWYGWNPSGYMDFYDQTNHSGRLPRPVMLLGPENDAFVDANGAVFSCIESENAVGYQLLFGSNPYRVMDYYIVSNTSRPPTDNITSSPFEQTWWTIRVRDQYGSTMYADPIHVAFENLEPSPIENITNGKEYVSFRQAIDEAQNEDEIVIKPGVYQEKINFKGKNLTLRSIDPNNPAVVSETVLIAPGEDIVTFSGGEGASCVLAGFTIADSNNGVYCSGASPTIVNCNIVGNVGDGMKLNMGSNPIISNCIIAGNGGSGIAMLMFKTGRMTLYNSPNVSNCTIVENSENGISEGMPTVLNSIIYGNSVQIAGSFTAVQYSNVQGGFPGEGNIDAGPLFANMNNGDYHLKSETGRWDSAKASWVIDEVTSPCIDAGDPNSPIGLEPLPNGSRINIGAYGGTEQASMSLLTVQAVIGTPYGGHPDLSINGPSYSGRTSMMRRRD